jgi:hypothetical protein
LFAVLVGLHAHIVADQVIFVLVDADKRLRAEDVGDLGQRGFIDILRQIGVQPHQRLGQIAHQRHVLVRAAAQRALDPEGRLHRLDEMHRLDEHIPQAKNRLATAMPISPVPEFLATMEYVMLRPFGLVLWNNERACSTRR